MDVGRQLDRWGAPCGEMAVAVAMSMPDGEAPANDHRELRRLYRQYLRRDPDADGTAHYAGRDKGDVIHSLLNSVELASRFPLMQMLPLPVRRAYLELCNAETGDPALAVADWLHPAAMSALVDPHTDWLDPHLEETPVLLGLTTRGRPSLVPTLRSLLAQKHLDGRDFAFDILVTLPLGCTLTVDQHAEIASLGPRVTIRLDRDWGPITKLLGPLAQTDDPDAIILLADDDVYYPEHHFSVLTAHHLALGAAVGTSGFNWNGELRRQGEADFVPSSYGQREAHLSEVHVIETWCGVCLRRGWFEDDFIRLAKYNSIMKPDMMRTDDGFYSCYLDHRHIGKFNINHPRCNRYESGHNDHYLALYSELNVGDDPLNGHDPVAMQWVRIADHLLEIQDDISRNCAPAPAGSDVMLLTVCVGSDYTRKVQAGRLSREAYCLKRDYRYAEVTRSLDETIPLIWTKLLAIRDALESGVDLLFYADADTIVTNPTVSIEMLAARSEADILFTYDLNGPNIGNLIVKNTEIARRIISDVCEMKQYHFKSPWYEQAAFMVYMRDHPELAAVVDGRPQREFNSYINNWHHNDFLVHLAGIYGPAVGDVMDAVHAIVYQHRRPTSATTTALSPFYADYVHDHRHEEHLEPTDLIEGDDLYVSVNNPAGSRPAVVFLFSQDQAARDMLRSALGNSAKVALWQPYGGDGGNRHWATQRRWFDRWNTTAPFIFADLSDDIDRVDEIWNSFASQGDVRLVLVSSSPDDRPWQIAHDVRTREHSLLIAAADFGADRAGAVARIMRFLDLPELAALMQAAYPLPARFQAPGGQNGVPDALFVHRALTGASIRPFLSIGMGDAGLDTMPCRTKP